jgi:hypothetical protein
MKKIIKITIASSLFLSTYALTNTSQQPIEAQAVNNSQLIISPKSKNNKTYKSKTVISGSYITKKVSAGTKVSEITFNLYTNKSVPISYKKKDITFKTKVYNRNNKVIKTITAYKIYHPTLIFAASDTAYSVHYKKPFTVPKGGKIKTTVNVKVKASSKWYEKKGYKTQTQKF